MSCLPPYPLRDQLRRPDRALKVFRRALVLSWPGNRGGLRAFPDTFRRSVHLLGRELFRPDEIVRLGLLRPDKSAAELRKVASRSAIERIAEALNPAAARESVANKGRFYKRCGYLGLPVPRLLGVVQPEAVEPWREFFLGCCPRHFVIKPAVDGFGRDVRVFERIGPETFVAADGRRLALDEMLRELAGISARSGAVIQERVWNHPGIERLSGSRYLQTARLITLLDRAGVPRVLHGHFKIIAGSNWVDNYCYGQTGNFIARIDLAGGRLMAGAAPDLERGGVLPVEHHPETGERVTDFQLPHWDRVIAQARELAIQFAPLRWVGWDIALTPDGAVAIEGNWNTDAPNNSQCLDRIFDDMRRWW